MHSFLSLICAFLTVSAPVSALVRLDTGVADVGFIGDEPNVRSSGRVPFEWRGSPSRFYPADANGLESARQGVPSNVLAVEWVSGSCGAEGLCSTAATSTFYGNFVNRDRPVIVPGTGRFEAWLGRFVDTDEDGHIRDVNSRTDVVHVSSTGGCGGGTLGAGTVGTGDPYGIVGLSVRCHRVDEWDGYQGTIVAYVTPGDWSGDAVNRAFEADPLAATDEGPERPDVSFAHVPRDEGVSGRYVAPASGFELVTLDGSLVQTTVVEAISSPITVFGGPRTKEAQTASLVDVDRYSSLDLTIESIYQNLAVRPAADFGCDPKSPEDGCPATTAGVLEPLRTGAEGAVVAVGPATGAFVADVERDPQEGARGGISPRLDLVAEASLAAPLVVTTYDPQARVTRDVPSLNGPASYDGTHRASLVLSLRARLGLWWDMDEDGWIGSPLPAPGCPDVHDCGARPDPHEYEDSRGEYIPLCGNRETGLAAAAAGSFFATAATASGHWGSGVYVMSDRHNALDSGDPLADDGRAAHNPYDDLLFASATSYVTSGPIQLTMTCTEDAPGTYRSYERIVFAAGANTLSDVTIHGSTTLDYDAWGISSESDVEDVDVLPRL